MHQGVDLPTGACGSLPRGVIATDLLMPRSRGGAGTEAGVGVETVAGEGSHTHTHTHTHTHFLWRVICPMSPRSAPTPTDA
jgi:hypothetical protein